MTPVYKPEYSVGKDTLWCKKNKTIILICDRPFTTNSIEWNYPELVFQDDICYCFLKWLIWNLEMTQ